MRDFPTLVQAMIGLDEPLSIAASWVVILSGFKAKVSDVRDTLERPAGVEVAQLNSLEVRRAYRRARVVVVPLYPSDMDNGVNVILEGMAVGRPVISSRTPGQIDVIEDGSNGDYVTPGSTTDLRAAIERILQNPDEAEDIGAQGRAYVERVHSIEKFVLNVESAVRETVRRGTGSSR